MAVINFPSNPTEGQLYTFNDFTYKFMGGRWISIQSSASTGIELFKAALADEGSTIKVAGVPAKDLAAQKDGVPVASVMWFPSRNVNASGYMPADGQVLSRNLYPSLWKLISENRLPMCSENDWNNDSTCRGKYTAGDGSTTFRIPDYNGKIGGSKGAAFLRGDGLNADAVGNVQSDAIRNLTGNVGAVGGANNRAYGAGFEWGDGVFSTGTAGGYDMGPISSTQATQPTLFNSLTFDASRMVLTAPEVRPVNVAGVWMIKVYSSAINEGVIDAVRLADALAIAEGKIAELESWPQSGSNSNGSWTKHRDGTLECSAAIPCPNKTIGQGTVSGFLSWNFPHAFIDTQLVVSETLCGIPQSGVGALRFSPEQFSKESLNVATANMSGVDLNISGAFLHLRVTGRWK